MTKSKARKILIALDDKTNPKKQKFAKKSAKKVNNVFVSICNAAYHFGYHKRDLNFCF